MHIYKLTQLGKRLARATNSPDTANWRVLHYLDGVEFATTDQIATYTGLEEGETLGALGTLKRKELVEGK